MNTAFQDVVFNRGWRLSEGGVYQRAAFFPNGWLKVRRSKRAAFFPNGRLKMLRSIQGGVYHRAAFIRGNTVVLNAKW